MLLSLMTSCNPVLAELAGRKRAVFVSILMFSKINLSF